MTKKTLFDIQRELQKFVAYLLHLQYHMDGTRSSETKFIFVRRSSNSR